MKNNKQISLEHSDLMFYSKELIQLKTPHELNVIFYSILIFFICIFISIFFIKIDNVVKVNGIIRTKDNNSEIKNVIDGTITSINYKPNQFVNEGDILLTLDDKEYQVVINLFESELENNKREIKCTKALLDYFETNINSYKDDEYINSKINSYQKTINYYKQQLQIYSYQYENEKNLPEAIKTPKNEKQALMEYTLCKEEYEKFKADVKSSTLETYKNLCLQNESLQQQYNQAQKKYSYLKIKAPVSGYIQEISSLNKGDYIFENQQILKIIPANQNDYRVELFIPPKNIGEISEGMHVKYRLSAFPFFEYRGAGGVITNMDPDIREDNFNNLVYCVYSDLDKTKFTNYKGTEYPVRAGIEVDARIVLEKITLVSYIFRKMGYLK